MARRPDGVLIASDGLSDPFDDEDEATVNGHQIEFFTIIAGNVGHVTESFAFDIVWRLSHRMLVDGALVGVLLGSPVSEVPADVAGPLSTIRLVGTTLLTPQEVRYASEQGEPGRRNLSDRLSSLGTAGWSSLRRPNVI